MLRNFLRRIPTTIASGSRPPLRVLRPALVQLEDRSVPAAITWTGATGASWAVASNWDLNRVPAAGDDVVIANGTTPDFNTTVAINTLTVAANSGLSESGGTLTIDSASTVDGAFMFNFGTLTGTGDVTINGLLTWHNGTMSGAGTTFANGGIALAVTGFPTLQGRRLDNNGTATWTGGGGSIIFSGGGTFNNNGTFDVQTDRPMGANGGGSPVFNNAGTFKKSAGTGITGLTVPFNNSGAVNLLTGTTSFGSGGAGPGTWEVAAAATLEFGGATFDLTMGSTISGAGSMRVVQGTVNLDGVYSAAATDLQSGHTIFGGPASTTTLAMGVGNGAPTLEGSGDVTVSGLLTWDSGTMTGAGTTFANGGLVLNPEQSNGLTIGGRRVDNNGAAIWTGNSFVFSDGGVFNNNGTFDARTDQTIGANGSGSPVFNNAGTFRKSAGAGTTSVTVPFSNTGTIEVRTGTLNLSGGLTNHSAGTSTLTGGTYDIAGTFQFPGAAVLTNAAVITLDGPGSAILNSATSVDALANFAANAAAGSFSLLNGRIFTTTGPFANAGNMTVDATGGSSSFTAAGAYTQTAGTTTLVAGGTLVSSTNSIAIQDGTLCGSGIVAGDVTNSGTVSPGQSPGVMVVNGDYTQDAAGTLDVEIGGTTPGTQYDQLQVSGAATLDGTLNVSLVNGFLPAVGDSFAVVPFASHSGDFATMTGLALGNARFLKERFDPTALNLDVILASLRYQTQPVDTPAGQSFPVVVEVTDGSGNVLTADSADQVTLALNQNSFAGGAAAVTRPVVNGVATFNLAIDRGATGYQLVTSGNGFADVPSNAFTVQQPASFTSAANTTFTAGTPGTFTVTAAGVPAAALSEDLADVPPSGVGFTDNGTGTATLAGTPASGTGGTYALHFTAANGVGVAATQLFILTVNEPPAFTSASSTAFAVGVAGSFTITTAGVPTPRLSETGALPSGVTFTDNGDGTATLAGTPTAGTGGTFTFTITASNGVDPDAVQPFTLTVGQAPAITSPDTATFAVGSPGTFTVTATGFPVPGLSEAGAFPAGVTFTDDGDGTATLGGTPAAGAGGTYPFTITASNGTGADATQAFTLTVNQAPAITSGPLPTDLATGTPVTVQVTATGFPAPTFTLAAGQLPPGLTINATGSITGVPTAGGTFRGTLRATNTAGTAVQPFTITVTASPPPGGGAVGQGAGFPFVISGGAAVVPLNPDGTTFGPSVDPFGPTPTRAVFADVTGDGTPDLVVGAGPGGSQVVVIDGSTHQQDGTFAPFGAEFTGGTFVAAGDVTGDGRADIAVSADATGGPRVVVIDGRTGSVLVSFFAIADPGFRGGARVALGDLNGDGTADLAVAAGPGGGPRVALYDGTTLRSGSVPTRLTDDFFVFEPTLRDGAYVSIGDVTGDGFGDLIAGACAGGTPRVLILSGQTVLSAGTLAAVGSPVASFFADDPAGRDGVRVAAKNLDGDRHADLVVAIPSAAGRRVVGFRGADLTARGQPPAFEDYSTAFDPLLTAVFVG